MTRSARGATSPSTMWWSNGSIFAAELKSRNEYRNQSFSPVISDSVWTAIAGGFCMSCTSEIRQLAEPPEPDSCGIVSTIRSTPSTAPALSTAVAPVSAARAASDCGPREFDSRTW